MESGPSELAIVTETKLVDYSPTRSCRSFLLFVVDNVLCLLLIGPLTVFYWRGTWTLLEVYIFPGNPAANGWTCLAVGNIGLICIVYLQRPLNRWLRMENLLHWIFGYHLYTYVLAGFNVFQWRGAWNLLDHYTGVNVVSAWTTFAIGQFGLLLLRSTKNACTPPMTVASDRQEDFFTFSTRFNTKIEQKEYYLLDTILTVCVIHQLVVFYFRGLWKIFDVHVLPHDKVMSPVISLIVACTLQVFVCLIQPGANFLYRSDRSKVKRWAFEVFVSLFACPVGVMFWRGGWLLIDVFFIPENPGLHGGVTHLIGIVGLWLMLCVHSVAAAGCDIDGESPDEEGCLAPNYYVRLYALHAPAGIDSANDVNGIATVSARSLPQENNNFYSFESRV